MHLSLVFALILLPPSQESWADTKLPPVPGLAGWYSADAQAKAFAARGQTAPKAGEGLAHLFDGSGRGQHLAQPRESLRPRLIRQTDSWLIRLDGEDDHLSRSSRDARPTGQLTLFAVLVPHQSPGSFHGPFALGATDGRDYETGFNIDLGSQFKEKFEALNIEGKGMSGGERNLLSRTWPLGEARRLTTVVGDTEASLWVDGVRRVACQHPCALRVAATPLFGHGQLQRPGLRRGCYVQGAQRKLAGVAKGLGQGMGLQGLHGLCFGGRQRPDHSGLVALRAAQGQQRQNFKLAVAL